MRGRKGENRNMRTLIKKIVLVIEDDPSTRLLLQLIIRSLQVRTITSPTIEQGCLVIAEKKPDLVVTDHCTNSEMTGLELIKLLRHQRNQTPIIMVSGTKNIPEQAIQEGAQYGFDKPIVSTKLIKAICLLLF